MSLHLQSLSEVWSQISLTVARLLFDPRTLAVFLFASVSLMRSSRQSVCFAVFVSAVIHLYLANLIGLTEAVRTQTAACSNQ